MGVRVRAIDVRLTAVLGVIVLLAAECAGSVSPNSGRPVRRPPDIALVNPPPVITPIQFVQINSATPQTSQTPVTARFLSTQTAGDLNVVVVSWNDSAATIQSVTDSSGNAYSLAVGPTILSGLATQSIYYAKNIATATANTVTVEFSEPALDVDLRILEYSGADLVSPLDVSIGATGTSGTTSSSGAVTTTTANDLLLGANYVETETTKAGTGYTKRLITSPDGDIVEDENVTA